MQLNFKTFKRIVYNLTLNGNTLKIIVNLLLFLNTTNFLNEKCFWSCLGIPNNKSFGLYCNNTVNECL